MTGSVVVFHPGRQHAVATAQAYFKAGMLSAFCTSLFYDPQRWSLDWLARMAPGVHAQLTSLASRGAIDELPPEVVLRYGLLEYAERGVRALGLPDLAARIDLLGNARFGRLSGPIIDRLRPAAVVAFNNTAKEIFQHAKSRGILCVLEQSLGHPADYNEIFEVHRQRYPMYFTSASPAIPDAWIKRQNVELELADLIIVGCDYAKASIEKHGARPERVRVVEYGHGFHELSDARAGITSGRSATEFIFVGAVGVRKGAHLLIEAMRRLLAYPVHLTMIGHVEPAIERLRERVPQNVSIVGKVSKREVFRHLANADCFVFPSLYEGSAIALREAQFAQLPIIQTERAGRGCRPGETGFYVEPDVDDLVRGLAAFADDANLRRRLVANAQSAPTRSWMDYQAEVVQVVSALIAKRS